MSEDTLYLCLMFWAGVLLTKSVFYFHQKNQSKKFYIFLAACGLAALENIYLSHMAGLDFVSKNIKDKNLDTEKESEEYLKVEKGKISILMEIYTLLILKALPKDARRHAHYTSWNEAFSLIEKKRGFTENEKNERTILENE